MILETQRLYLREMTQDDYADLCEILQDKDAMYAYEHAFSDEEAHDWLDRQLARYETYGFGLWAVIDRETGTFLGQAGLPCRTSETRKYWRSAIFSNAGTGITDTPPKPHAP